MAGSIPPGFLNPYRMMTVLAAVSSGRASEYDGDPILTSLEQAGHIQQIKESWEPTTQGMEVYSKVVGLDLSRETAEQSATTNDSPPEDLQSRR